MTGAVRALFSPAMTRPLRSQSPELVSFIRESPLDRPAIFSFLQRLAAGLPAGTRVLDAGAGNAPYRELFAGCLYTTSDWAQSIHPGARHADVVAPLGALPLDDASFEVVVNTQVLEHVSDPGAVLSDFHRLLVAEGELWLTAPFVWELHEEPHDYFRYTSHGLQALLERSGFTVAEIRPLGGYFSTIAQLLRHCGGISGLSERGLLGRVLGAMIWRMAPVLRRLDVFDSRQALTLGWTCRAIKVG